MNLIFLTKVPLLLTCMHLCVSNIYDVLQFQRTQIKLIARKISRRIAKVWIVNNDKTVKIVWCMCLTECLWTKGEKMAKMHEAGMYHFALLLMMHRVRCILSFKACYITTCVQCTMYIARYTRYFYANSSLFFSLILAYIREKERRRARK